uniref:Uncharacterized protein n=1 Tax=Romanomermis culicivorax TaxID=13658 RepID=A0A915JNC9_ROMCU
YYTKSLLTERTLVSPLRSEKWRRNNKATKKPGEVKKKMMPRKSGRFEKPKLAFKTKKYLFRCDHIAYTLVVITSITELISTVNDHNKQVKHVLLINCGANVNIIDVLQAKPDVKFFILDSRRPFDLDNIFDQRQINLLIDERELKGLSHPKLEEIYREDSGMCLIRMLPPRLDS